MDKLKSVLQTAMEIIETANQRQTLLSISDVQRYLNQDELNKLQMETQSLASGIDSLLTLAFMLEKEPGLYSNGDTMDLIRSVDELKKQYAKEIHDADDQ